MAIPLFMSLPSQWFYKRRGMASGIAIGGAGIGGGIIAQVLQPLLVRFGFKYTMM
jgi:nitrate/nitrite transporter NarK